MNELSVYSVRQRGNISPSLSLVMESTYWDDLFLKWLQIQLSPVMTLEFGALPLECFNFCQKRLNKWKIEGSVGSNQCLCPPD